VSVPEGDYAEVKDTVVDRKIRSDLDRPPRHMTHDPESLPGTDKCTVLLFLVI
jgi:hypothetical protein